MAQVAQLVMAVHTVEAATAKVPFSMILLLDHAKRKSIPEEFKLRMAIPSDGLVSVSLWDITGDAEALAAWCADNLGGDCITQVHEVQEDFTFGLALELARARSAEKVAGRSKATIGVIGERTTKAAEMVAAGVSTAVENTHQRLEEWDKRTGVLTNAKSTTAATVTKISSAVAKAAESEQVKEVAAVVQSGWKTIAANLGVLGERVARMTGAEGGPGAPPAYYEHGGSDAHLHGDDAAGAGPTPGGAYGGPARPEYEQQTTAAAGPPTLSLDDLTLDTPGQTGSGRDPLDTPPASAAPPAPLGSAQ